MHLESLLWCLVSQSHGAPGASREVQSTGLSMALWDNRHGAAAASAPRETVKALMSGPEQSLLDAFKAEWAERVYARRARAALCRASAPAASQTRLTGPTPAAKLESHLATHGCAVTSCPPLAAHLGGRLRLRCGNKRGVVSLKPTPDVKPGDCDLWLVAQGERAARAIAPTDRPWGSSQDPAHAWHQLYVRSHGARPDSLACQQVLLVAWLRAHRRQSRAWRAAWVQLGRPGRRPQVWCAPRTKGSFALDAARCPCACAPLQDNPLLRRAGVPASARCNSRGATAASSGVRSALQHDSCDRVPAVQPWVCAGSPSDAAAGVRTARAELSAGELITGSYSAAQQQPDADLGRSQRPGWRSAHKGVGEQSKVQPCCLSGLRCCACMSAEELLPHHALGCSRQGARQRALTRRHAADFGTGLGHCAAGTGCMSGMRVDQPPTTTQNPCGAVAACGPHLGDCSAISIFGRSSAVTT